MNATLTYIGRTVRSRKARWASIVVGFVLLYYLTLLTTMLIRFGEIPNYVTFYNWPANIWTIFASTPSLVDAINIAREEWLIEIGFMNYNFGNGISEWSVTVWPTKLVMVIAAGALIATLSLLLFRPSSSGVCSTATRRSALVASSGGAFLVGLSSATLSWVVCCATPTWVVSLALLGMSPGLALWLEPLGGGMILAGYALLTGAVLVVARRQLPDGSQGSRKPASLNETAFSKG